MSYNQLHFQMLQKLNEIRTHYSEIPFWENSKLGIDKYERTHANKCSVSVWSILEILENEINILKMKLKFSDVQFSQKSP